METTTFKFEVNGQAFDGALDLFSQFFKKPLFTADAIGTAEWSIETITSTIAHDYTALSVYTPFNTVHAVKYGREINSRRRDNNHSAIHIALLLPY